MEPSIWTGMYGDLPLPEALRRLSDCGWRRFEIATEHLVSIETAADGDAIIAETRDCVSELGLATPQAHALLKANVAAMDTQNRERDVGRLLHHIEIAAKLSVEIVVIHPGGYDPEVPSDPDEVIPLNVVAFRRLGDAAAGHGMRIGIENLPYPGITTAREVLYLLQQIDHPAIGVNFDTSHANMCSIDSAAMARELGDTLISTHISDNDGSGDQHLTPGGGTIDWIELMKAFREIGYEGDLNLELPGERHRVAGLRLLKTRHALDVAHYLVRKASRA